MREHINNVLHARCTASATLLTVTVLPNNVRAHKPSRVQRSKVIKKKIYCDETKRRVSICIIFLGVFASKVVLPF